MTAAPPKFPLPFADRPGFVPRSIDPKVPMKYYPGENPGREFHWPRVPLVALAFILACVGAAMYGMLVK